MHDENRFKCLDSTALTCYNDILVLFGVCASNGGGEFLPSSRLTSPLITARFNRSLSANALALMKIKYDRETVRAKCVLRVITYLLVTPGYRATTTPFLYPGTCVYNEAICCLGNKFN